MKACQRWFTGSRLLFCGAGLPACLLHTLAGVPARDIPISRLEVIEGAGHGMIWSHPEIVVDIVGEFLAGDSRQQTTDNR